MSTGVLEDLQHAGRCVEDARSLTYNATALLARISPQLAEEALHSVTTLENLSDQLHGVTRALESAT